jgi:hypothetical protein
MIIWWILTSIYTNLIPVHGIYPTLHVFNDYHTLKPLLQILYCIYIMSGLLLDNLTHIDHIQWQNLYVIARSLSNLDCASLNINNYPYLDQEI